MGRGERGRLGLMMALSVLLALGVVAAVRIWHLSDQTTWWMLMGVATVLGFVGPLFIFFGGDHGD